MFVDEGGDALPLFLLHTGGQAVLAGVAAAVPQTQVRPVLQQ